MALEQVLKIVTDLHRRIPGSPVPSAEALLSLPGVLRQAQADQQDDKAARKSPSSPAGRMCAKNSTACPATSPPPAT